MLSWAEYHFKPPSFLTFDLEEDEYENWRLLARLRHDEWDSMARVQMCSSDSGSRTLSR